MQKAPQFSHLRLLVVDPCEYGSMDKIPTVDHVHHMVRGGLCTLTYLHYLFILTCLSLEQCKVDRSHPRDRVIMQRGSVCLDLFNYNNWRQLLSAMCPDIDWEADMQQY